MKKRPEKVTIDVWPVLDGVGYWIGCEAFVEGLIRPIFEQGIEVFAPHLAHEVPFEIVRHQEPRCHNPALLHEQCHQSYVPRWCREKRR